MTTTTPVAELLFGADDGTPVSTDEATLKPWSLARACLESASKVWLCTVRSDGRPHAAPVHLVMVDDRPCFTTRSASRKARNIAVNARCLISVFGQTLDLAVEGNAVRLRDEPSLRNVAEAFKDKYEWELTVRDGSVYEDSLPGSPEFGFYQITPGCAFGYGTDGMTATRWRWTRGTP